MLEGMILLAMQRRTMLVNGSPPETHSVLQGMQNKKWTPVVVKHAPRAQGPKYYGLGPEYP